MYRAPVPTTPRPRAASPRRLTALAAGGLALPLLLGACSSSSTAGGTTTTTRAAGHQGSTSVCSLVTPAEIQAQLDKAVKAPLVQNTAAATLCTYPSAHTSEVADSVVIGFRANVTDAVAGAKQAQARKKFGQTTDASGGNDTAYYYQVTSGGKTVTSLVTLVGTTQVTVTSTATVPQAEALTQQVFDSFASAASSTTTAPA